MSARDLPRLRFDEVRTELLVGAEMRAFAEEVDVLFREHGSYQAIMMPMAILGQMGGIGERPGQPSTLYLLAVRPLGYLLGDLPDGKHAISRA